MKATLEALTSRLDTHEKVCTERWETTEETLTRIEAASIEYRQRLERKVDQINVTFFRQAVAIIALLTGLTGFLAQRLLFH